MPESPNKGWKRQRAVNVAARDRGRLIGRPDAREPGPRRSLPAVDRPGLTKRERKQISATVRTRHQLEVELRGKQRIRAWCTCGRWKVAWPATQAWRASRRSFNRHVDQALYRRLQREERHKRWTTR
jgi:hypothetical protein